MEFDQILFKRFYKYYQKVRRKKDPELLERRVQLDDIKPRLTLLARALTGKPNEILTSEREGGFSGLRFYLPKQIDLFSSAKLNLEFYLFRTLYLSVQQSLLLNWPTKEQHGVEESQVKANEASSGILKLLFDEYPATQHIYENLNQELTSYYIQQKLAVDTSWLYGRFMALRQNELNAIASAPIPTAHHELNQEITTQIDAKPSDEVQVVGVDEKQVEDNIISNNFEKVETLSEFNGNFREMDGDDTLADDEEALQELNLKHTVRTADTSHSVYQAEMANGQSNILVSDNIEPQSHFTYPEWDYKKRAYKHNFCKVYPEKIKVKSVDYAYNVLKNRLKTKNELFRMFAQVQNDFERVNRMEFGEDFDLDALMDYQFDLLAKKSPSEKVYFTKRKRKKDLSVLILMDTSLSSDSYTNNEHVLTTEKESVLLFGEVLETFGIAFQIDTFSSKTRNHCSYKHVKTFKENWSSSKNRIGAIQAEGFTRIGAALRHAASTIEMQPTSRKWIVLLSDGKPNDYDTYEGKYGIEDVKQALRELDKQHINTFSFAIEHQAKLYLPQMFGHANYNILPTPSDLPFAFSKFYKRILLS
jgi:nitric oxide reductase NorD protein